MGMDMNQNDVHFLAPGMPFVLFSKFIVSDTVIKEPHLKQCSIAKMECHAMICGSNASWLAALSNKAPMV